MCSCKNQNLMFCLIRYCKADLKLLEMVFLIAICCQSGNKWQSKTLFIMIFYLHSSTELTFSISPIWCDKFNTTFILQFCKHLLLMQFCPGFIFCTFKVSLIPFGRHFSKTEHMAFITLYTLEKMKFLFSINLFHKTV